jgi:hypothetical protein
MALDSRFSDIVPDEIAKPSIRHNGVLYIRSEYFNDGQRVFFSPLDFAMNGPDEGSIISRKEEESGCEHTLKVLAKYHERGDEIPCMVEVELTTTIDNQVIIADRKLWVIVQLTETTKSKFKLNVDLGVRGVSYALVPDFFVGIKMGYASPNNDVSFAFSFLTGISKHTLILGDRV